jgi:hypothetical protein
MPKNSKVLGLNGFQYGGIKILLAAKVTLDTRHVIHDQQFAFLLMDIAGGFSMQVLVAAESAMLGHGFILVRKDS